MPTLQTMNLPKPLNWQEFESIVRDAMSQKWKSSTLTKNGRPGQKQQGVDIFGPDDLGRATGIQCKRFSGALDLKTVEDEIEKAAKFKGNLTTLFIATTSDHDSKLQEQVRVLSEQRASQKLFAVGILFWEEIVAGLVLNSSVFSNHYPQLLAPDSGLGETPQETLIGALELGYYGGSLKYDVKLIFGEFGWMAQEDPDQLFVAIRILERRASQLLAPDDAQGIIHSLRTLTEHLESSEPDWDDALFIASRATNRIKHASSLLQSAESNFLELGLALKRISNQHKNLNKTTKLIIKKRIRYLLSGRKKAINEAFKAAADNKLGYIWAVKIYNFVDSELRFN
ncbi:restriction endonuclease [Pseudomonas sp. CHM02]|uniref:restriction endonuclease n=1 Tax=Pseudomonas sp. CHM02 TaxID=1463662 RepID=UPI00046FAF70|nr:restriction endonuclease [Pseudomonas sp. CHM02]